MSDEKKAVIKKAGEKMLRVTVYPHGDRIGAVLLEGDFFLYPEESVHDLESCLVNVKPGKSAIIEAVEQETRAKNIEMVGLSPATIAEGICMAMEVE